MPDDPKRPSFDDLEIHHPPKLTVTPPPKNLLIPEEFGEPTPVVTKQEIAWREIGRISKSVRGLVRAANNQAEYVKQIPDITRDARAAKTSAESAKVSADKARQRVEVVETKLGTQFAALDRRVDRVESEEHDCTQVSVIGALQHGAFEIRKRVERDVTEGVRTRERLDSTRTDLEAVDEEVKKFSSARRNFFMGLLGLIIFGLSSIGSLVWFLGSLDSQFEAEQRARREGEKRLEAQVKALGKTANTAPVKQEIESLTRAVRDRHETTESYCSTLSDRTVVRMKGALAEREWPRCRRFGFEVSEL